MTPDGPLVFIHIPKTAGTSLRIAFASILGDEETLWVYPRASWATPAADVADLAPKRLSRARLVMGHFMFGLHHQLPPGSRYATVLRRPVDRVISAYFHNVRAIRRRTKDGRPMNAWQRAIAEDGIGLAGFARSEAGGRRVAPSQNQQVRMIAGRNHIGGDPEATELLDIALEHVERDFAAVGITDDAGGFAAALAAREGWGEGIELPTVNRNPGRPAEGEIDPAELAVVKEHNALDIALYDHIVGLIAKAGSPLV